MFTPQEVQDKKFPKAVFGGYDMGEVDDFLDAVSADYAALYKENAVLKNKLKVLAEKVEEYRSVDTAMRKALIAAQKMAAEMTEEAKAKSEEIKNKAIRDYENSIAALRDSIRNEERRLESIKEETRKFVDASIRICQNQIDNLKRMIAEPDDTKGSFDEKAEEIEKSVNEAISEEIPAPGEDVEGAGSDLHGMVPDMGGASPAAGREEAIISGSAEFHDFGDAFSSADTEDFALSAGEPDEPFTPAGKTARAAAKPKAAGRGGERVREINVGGTNIRVFEMDLGGDGQKNK